MSSSKRSFSSYSDPFGTNTQLAHYESQLRNRPRSASRPVGRVIKGSYSAAKGAPKSFRVRASPALKRVISSMITRQKEQKLDVTLMYGGNLTSLLATDGTSTVPGAAPLFVPMAPAMGQGGADGARVGSDIRLTKSYVKFQLTLNQEASGDAGPFIATVWIGKVRSLGAALPNAADFSSLLMTQTSNSFIAPTTTIPVTGLLPVNDDLWDIKVRKDYKLGKESTTNSTNNDFNLCYNDEIDITKMFPRKLRYNGSDTVVSDDNLYFFVTYRTLNGAVALGGLPQVVANAVHRYTDA